jgi:predicted phosphate transport protein (TIGR00153 family)
MMRLLPRDEQFFELFTQIAERAVEVAKLLGELLGEEGARRTYLIETISRVEREADQLTHDVTVRLDRSFITPLDREDIHFLASSLDNVIDRTDGIARRTKIFRVGRSPSGAVMIADVIHRATLQLLTAVRHLGKSDQYPILEACREVRRLEEEGDALYHEWLGQLFDGGLDALEVIKWKEIYDKLENTLDSAEDVANTLESVAIKHG